MTDKIQIAELGDLIKAVALANEHFGEGFCWWRGEDVIEMPGSLGPKFIVKHTMRPFWHSNFLIVQKLGAIIGQLAPMTGQVGFS